MYEINTITENNDNAFLFLGLFICFSAFGYATKSGKEQTYLKRLSIVPCKEKNNNIMPIQTAKACIFDAFSKYMLSSLLSLLKLCFSIILFFSLYFIRINRIKYKHNIKTLANFAVFE